MRIERLDWDGADAPAFAGRLRALAPAGGEVRAEVRADRGDGSKRR